MGNLQNDAIIVINSNYENIAYQTAATLTTYHSQCREQELFQIRIKSKE